jgi:hypothetical protein
MLLKCARYNGFRTTRVTEVEELQCTLIEFEHEESGAQIIHIKAPDPENFFCLSFRTLPASSNGVAHILEHIVLAGSEKYPLKDPFFSMTRRSLHTFMNALTGDDFTCYPAASCVEQDFYNLLSVYLDAVFHPLLLPESFAQEGWRLEFRSPSDPKSPLQYKGVVYNEMKGALAGPERRLTEAISAALFPNSPYGYNSGGSPEAIPSLSREELLAFHRTFYHPSHCLFFFYGDIPCERHLDFLSEHALKGIKKAPSLPPIPLQPLFPRPHRTTLSYPLSTPEVDAKSYLGFAWLTTRATNQMEVLALSVLDSILMDNDASLLRRRLLQSGLAKSASAWLDTENIQVPYVITLKGVRSRDVDSLEELIFKTLSDIVKAGLSEECIERALHQLELDRQEIGHDGIPFGLALFGRAALLFQHGGKPEDGLRTGSLFTELREKLGENPHFLLDLLSTYFIKNSHFVRICLEPDPHLLEKEAEKEQEKLVAFASKLSPQDSFTLVEKANALAAYQEASDGQKIELLPIIKLEDVPRHERLLPLTEEREENLTLFIHNTFTNHFTYADLIFPLPRLRVEDLPFVRLFCLLAIEVGSGGRSWDENLNFMDLYTGGISLVPSLHHQAHDADTFSPTLHLRGKSLTRNSDKLFSLLFDTVTSLNFSERARIRELLVKLAENLESNLPQNGLKYAQSLSLAHLGAANYINEAMYGLSFFHTIRSLVANYDAREEELMGRLEELKTRLTSTGERHLCMACELTEISRIKESRAEGLFDLPAFSYSPWKNDFPSIESTSKMYLFDSPVAFSAKSFRVLSYTHPDSAALCLAANLFDNICLHKRLREQGGAYGGGASYNPLSGNFSFYAFRDPNIASTMEAFREAIDLLLEGHFSLRELEEAKLEMMQVIDAPLPPSSRGEVAYARYREGRSQEVRGAFRERIFRATPDDIQNAAVAHIVPHFEKALFVTFCGKEVAAKENKKLSKPLVVEKVLP